MERARIALGAPSNPVGRPRRGLKVHPTRASDFLFELDTIQILHAVVLLFKNISETGETKFKLIDGTGTPYDSDNVATDDFERNGILQLKKGAALHEKVVIKDGKPQLRSLTAVPVVMEKCVMCHSHYADVKKGEPIGAISYTIPIE